ncbi:MAG: AAA family ATPase [Opitutae bacterium]|nr:AAA family ATPase [Opitutae bacterium]
MQRWQEAELDAWLGANRRKPLVIRGARQVGKSTLVRQFASRRNLVLFEVNLERQTHLRGPLEKLNPEDVVREIEFLCRKGRMKDHNALLFLDEIQGVPRALECLRYFFEDMPELPVIAAGSLLEFTLANHRFPMPVGRIEYMHIGPVTFEEYLREKGEPQLCELLHTYELEEAFPQSAHLRLLGILREYLLVGGMPEAAQLFLETGDFRRVFEIQEAIWQTYRDDFSKYASGGDLVRLQRVVDYMPRGVGSKVKYVNIDRESYAKDVRQAIDLLAKAGVVEKVFKLYGVDIGLLMRASGIEHLSEEQMMNVRFTNEGKLTEQFIAQHLFFSENPRLKPELHYWLREGGTGNAEVNFQLAVAGRVIPVEVKSGKSGSLKSMLQYSLDKGCDLSGRFDLNPPSVQAVCHKIGDREVAFELVSLPLYLCGQFRRLFASRTQLH